MTLENCLFQLQEVTCIPCLFLAAVNKSVNYKDRGNIQRMGCLNPDFGSAMVLGDGKAKGVTTRERDLEE